MDRPLKKPGGVIPHSVIPAKAGIHFAIRAELHKLSPDFPWMPAFAGMTAFGMEVVYER